MAGDVNNRQIEIAEELQMLVLEDFLDKLREGKLGSTDRRTLVNLLMQNGWSLDPASLPQGISEKLTEVVDPEDLDDYTIDELKLRRLIG